MEIRNYKLENKIIEKDKLNLEDTIKEWDGFRIETMENMFHQFKYGSMKAFKEATVSYKNAIDLHTGLYLMNINYKENMYGKKD